MKDFDLPEDTIFSVRGLYRALCAGKTPIPFIEDACDEDIDDEEDDDCDGF